MTIPLNLRFVACAALLGALLGLVFAGRAPSGPTELERLQEQIRKADRVVVIQDYLDPKVVYSSTEAKDREALLAAIQIQDTEENLHCMCLGSPIIRLYHKDTLLTEVSNHHATLLRCSLWSGDKPIKDQEAWLRWFDQRGVTGPRQEVQEVAEDRKRQGIDEARWLSAMPASVRPLWEGLRQRGGIVDDLQPFREAMLQGTPPKTQRIRTLLSWYGSGAGPWTGFPAYEEVPEKMLLEYAIEDLVAAAMESPLSTPETEGLARLLSSWSFGKQRPSDLKRVPAGLKQQLLAHTLASQDKDKQSRARHALS